MFLKPWMFFFVLLLLPAARRRWRNNFTSVPMQEAAVLSVKEQ